MFNTFDKYIKQLTYCSRIIINFIYSYSPATRQTKDFMKKVIHLENKVTSLQNDLEHEQLMHSELADKVYYGHTRCADIYIFIYIIINYM